MKKKILGCNSSAFVGLVIVAPSTKRQFQRTEFAKNIALRNDVQSSIFMHVIGPTCNAVAIFQSRAFSPQSCFS